MFLDEIINSLVDNGPLTKEELDKRFPDDTDKLASLLMSAEMQGLIFRKEEKEDTFYSI